MLLGEGTGAEVQSWALHLHTVLGRTEQGRCFMLAIGESRGNCCNISGNLPPQPQTENNIPPMQITLYVKVVSCGAQCSAAVVCI